MCGSGGGGRGANIIGEFVPRLSIIFRGYFLRKQVYYNIMTAHTATEIQAMVRTMDGSKEHYAALKTANPEEYLAKLRGENPILYDSYPAVFALHADDKLDETFFYMLQEKRKMEAGKSTEDESSIRVGQKLFQTWVAPIINGTPSPSKQTYAEYYSSLPR